MLLPVLARITDNAEVNVNCCKQALAQNPSMMTMAIFQNYKVAALAMNSEPERHVGEAFDWFAISFWSCQLPGHYG